MTSPLGEENARFEADLLAAASDADAAGRLALRARVRAVVAVATNGYAAGDGSSWRATSLVARVARLLACHAASFGGELRPSGVDVCLAAFPGVPAALDAVRALRAELDAARDPGSHRHGGLVGVGVVRGPVLEAPDGRLLGEPVARALRLAVGASPRGEVLADAGDGLPDGVGHFMGRPDAVARMGFPFVHVADHRA